MDPHGHNPPPPMMMVGSEAPSPYGAPHHANQIPSDAQLTQAANPQLSQEEIAYRNAKLQHRQKLQVYLQAFWANQQRDIERTYEFKGHSLPLARIKKIMKADEDVRMIAAEAPVVFARACEMFILELTLRAWNHTEENKRRTLQKYDIGAAIRRTEVLDFLTDIAPREEFKDDQAAAAAPMTNVAVAGPVPQSPLNPDPLSYCYMPPQHLPEMGMPGMMMGNNPPMVDPTGMYAFPQQDQSPYMDPEMWQPPPDYPQQMPPDF